MGMNIIDFYLLICLFMYWWYCFNNWWNTWYIFVIYF